jgi:hypothetical protein
MAEPGQPQPSVTGLALAASSSAFMRATWAWAAASSNSSASRSMIVRASRARAQARAQAVAVKILHNAGFAIHDGQRAFGAGWDAGSAAVALLFVDFHDLADYVGDGHDLFLPCLFVHRTAFF